MDIDVVKKQRRLLIAAEEEDAGKGSFQKKAGLAAG